jgi:phospholipid N-methyltransferase
MSLFGFFWEGLKNLKTVGTVTRTSGHSSKAVVAKLNIENIKIIIELGAGDGAITKEILRQLRPDAVLMVFEVNEQFCTNLKELHDARMIIIQDSAEKMPHYLQLHGIEHVDAIVSALPFAIIPDEITKSILSACKKILVRGGDFVQIHYSLSRKKMYESIFGKVKVDVSFLNLPPLFILHSRNSS